MVLDKLIIIFNIIGNFLVIISLYPQIFKCIKNKSTKDISSLWIIINSCGLVLLIINSILENNVSIYIIKSLQLIFLSFLGYLKLFYENNENNENNIVEKKNIIINYDSLCNKL